MTPEDRLQYFLQNQLGCLFKVVKKYVNDHAIRKDIVQESCISMHLKIHTFKGTTHAQFTAWCKTIARNEARDYLRRLRSGKHRITAGIPVDDETFDLLVDDRTSIQLDRLAAIDERAEAKAWYEKVRQWVDETPLQPEHREAFDAVYFEGMTHRKAAELLDITPGLLRTRLHRALQSIRNYIASQLN